MSSKRLAYLLTVLVVCGFIATGTAQGQTFGTVLISGTITNPDGTPAAGLEVRAETIPFAPDILAPLTFTSRNDGTFSLASQRGTAKISVGDIIKLTVTNADGDVVGEERLTITDDANTTFAGNAVIIKDIDIPLRESGIDVGLDPAALYADGTATSAITVTVLDDGTGVTGDTITLSAGSKGTIDATATEVGNGVYTVTYTAPLLDLTIPDVVNITAVSATTGLEKTVQLLLLPVPTTVTVELGKSRFTADTPETTTVTVTVKRAAPVTDENVTLSLSPAVGTLSSSTATNNGDGTYTATYTSGGTVEEVTLTATATLANRSDEATIFINAGPPAEIVLSANPTTVTSLGSSTITAMVTDSSGNPVGGLSLTTSSETVSEFTSTAFGTYTATYSAPMVDAEGTETITISTDGVSADLTLNLTPEPPIEVSLIEIGGTVYKEDGEVPAESVDVEITVGSQTQMDTTDTNGFYSVGFVGIGTPAAKTGYLVSVVVADANVVALDVNGIEQGGSQFPLVNDILEKVLEGMSVMVDVTTNIVIPPRSVSLLTVEGTVFKEGGTISAGGGLEVTVTVGSQAPQMDTTDTNGFYSVAFVGLGTPAAKTDDPISVEVRDGSGVRGTNPPPPKEATLSNTDLGITGAATVMRNVDTNIKLASNLLVVEGTVYLKNGDTPVPATSNLRESDLTVVVTNTTRDLTKSVSVKDDGTYGLVFQSLGGAAVVETGDELTFEVQNEAGESVESESDTLILAGADVQAARVEKAIHTTVRAVVNTLHVIGDVVELDGSPAAGVQVTMMVIIDGDITDQRIQTTDATGGYEDLFLKLGTPLAATGDVLLVEASRESDQFRGYAEITLSSHQLLNQPLMVPTIILRSPRLELGGLSINPHYTGIQDPIIQQFLNMDLAGLATAAGTSIGGPEGDLLVSLPPSPFVILSPVLAAIGALQLELPQGFDSDNPRIVKENFGNAITTRPTAWAAFPAAERFPGRWVNGDQLNLYVSGASTIESVTFTLNGSPMSATRVPAGGSFTYNFQLEEEWIALFSGSMPAFKTVQLMIDDRPHPIDMTWNDMGVWSAPVELTPGSHVSYYYMIELYQPYHDPMGGLTITRFPFIDPRNRQVRTAGLSQLFEALLGSELAVVGDSVRSVFSVPEANGQQSLWVGTLPLNADGEYMLNVDVGYRGGYQEPEPITATFTVDRTPPTADVALNLSNPGMNVGMYPHPTEAGVFVATGPMPGEASLTVSIPRATSDEPDGAGYMYQLALLDSAGNPGIWNPVITADLLPLNLEKLLNDPTSVLPLTGGGPIEMLIRNSGGGALYGRYGLRAVGIDSLLNMDSGRGPGVVVDLVPPDPDVALVTSVQSDFDGNGVIEGLERQYTSGDVAVFSDSVVELTVYMRHRTEHPLKSVTVEFQLPGGDWQLIGLYGADQLISTMQGDEFSFSLPIPDIPFLPDRGMHIMLRTVTTNALDVVNREVFSAAYQRRTAPEVSGIYTSVTDRHPDSGAPQGMITISAFTQAMTAPNTAAVQLEIRRSADADWMPLGSVPIADTTVTSHVEIAIIEDLVNSILSGSPTAPISPLYRKWSLAVDSATLEDTILDDTPAASDASLDDNPYVIRAVAVDMAGTAYPSADGITDSISLDNYSPTAITTVANEVDMVAAREDGSYYVSGLIAEGVPDPMLALTSRTGAHPSAFTGGIALAVNDASGTAVEIPATGFSGSGNYTFTGVFNLASIPNGTYTFMAAAHAADGSPEARIVAMAITVEVGNFTPPDNFADPSVDVLSVTNTRGEANSPSEIDAMYPIGFPAIDDKVTATLIVPNVSGGDVDVLIGDDGMSASAMGILMVMVMHDTNSLVIMIDASGLDEGMYGLVGTVTKPNGSVQFGLPSIRVDRSAPVIEIVSPLAGHQVTSLPTIQVSYTDATGFDPETSPMPVEITLTRLTSTQEIDVNESMIRMMAAEGEVLTQTGSIVYTHDDPLAGGAYRIGVSVTDALGNTATAEPVEVTSEGVAPTVTIITPASGQVVDPDQPLVISAALSGSGEITVTRFKLNSAVIEVAAKDNWLTYTMEPPLAGKFLKRGSGNTVTIEIVDAEGNTAEATSTFALAFDKTPPVVATYSPQGIIRTDRPIAAATVTDESGIKMNTLTIIIAGVPGNQGSGRRSSPTSTTITFTPSISVTPGPYTARVTVEDVNGNRTEAEWQFTVELDVTPPAITTSSPQGVVRSDKPIISVSASDDMSGVDTIEIGVKGEGNRTVEGLTSVRSDRTSATFTPTTALTSGVYTVDVKLADMSGNKASGQWQFTVELDTIPPSIVITRPTQEYTENRRPIISATYTDNLSGVDADSVTLSLDGTTVTPDAVSETQVTFTSPFDLTFGQHTVTLEVSDMASTPNTATQEWSFFVERVGIADARNYPNPFEDGTTITFRLSRQASISVRIYDFTGRLVAQPITNSLREAGPVEIAWSGDTSAGENLARGVYFCHILMESELEPQSAILKMAIISE